MRRLVVASVVTLALAGMAGEAMAFGVHVAPHASVHVVPHVTPHVSEAPPKGPTVERPYWRWFPWFSHSVPCDPSNPADKAEGCGAAE
jgi:L-alanine-DL-glutamate epimerase-like enolase superfamily enzyme